MLKLQEELTLSRPAREVFAYACEFENCPEWDSTAVQSEKLSAGPTAIGTTYKVVCTTPLGKLTLRYEVIDWKPDELVILRGSCSLFTVTDTITVSALANGSHLSYVAEFELKPLFKGLEGKLEAGLKRMGKKSIEGLEQALERDFPPPTLDATARLADKFVLPGVARFSKLGFTLSRKHWNPDSSYMGDKHILLTGATSGIGLAAAKRLAARNARLTLVVRDAARGKQLVEKLSSSTGNTRITAELADMSVMSQVSDLVERLLKKNQPIDVLINNAGALFNPRRETAEGMENSFALLLLGPYLLTEGLLPLLQRSENTARIINVVSGGMYTQKLEVDQLQSSLQPYSGSVAYARAKRGLMIQTERWAEAWQDLDIVCNAMHPGWADTPGVADALPGFHRLTRCFLRTPDEGADTIVWLAAAQESGLVSGQLFLDRQPHSTHLLRSTRENDQERDKLAAYLHDTAAPFLPAH